MTTKEKTNISINTVINATLQKVWELWTRPEHIIQWNNASQDWHTTRVENDLREGGKFSFRMEAKDGSMGFDFSGAYKEIITLKHISYILDDERKVSVDFETSGTQTKITQIFETETVNPTEMQKNGWQAILNNFKNYTETH